MHGVELQDVTRPNVSHKAVFIAQCDALDLLAESVLSRPVEQQKELGVSPSLAKELVFDAKAALELRPELDIALDQRDDVKAAAQIEMAEWDGNLLHLPTLEYAAKLCLRVADREAVGEDKWYGAGLRVAADRIRGEADDARSKKERSR